MTLQHIGDFYRRRDTNHPTGDSVYVDTNKQALKIEGVTEGKPIDHKTIGMIGLYAEDPAKVKKHQLEHIANVVRSETPNVFNYANDPSRSIYVKNHLVGPIKGNDGTRHEDTGPIGLYKAPGKQLIIYEAKEATRQASEKTVIQLAEAAKTRTKVEHTRVGGGPSMG